MLDTKILGIGVLVTAAIGLLKIIEAKFKSTKYTIKNYDKKDLKQYTLGKSILTGPELVLYRVINKHMKDEFIIGTKIRLADFINIKRKMGKSGPLSTQALFSRISSKHCDYMICNLKGKPLAWIELDDKTHGSSSAKKADKFKNELAKTIGIPLHRIKTGTDYNAQIRNIKSSLK